MNDRKLFLMLLTGLGVMVLTFIFGVEPAKAQAPVVNPVNCASLTGPVVGLEISRGQLPADVAGFIQDLMADGFSVGTVDLTGGSIPTCVDVLIVVGLAQNSTLSAQYTAADGTLLQSWVAGGHGLLLLGDWGPFRADTDALFQAFGYGQQGVNAVSDPTDFDTAGPATPPATWVIYQSDNFAAHPIFSGISSFELLASSYLSPTTAAIVTTDANAAPATAPVAAAFIDNAGCAVLVADSNWATEDGYTKENNATVARQAVSWLNHCTELSLTKRAAPNRVQAGHPLTYTLTVINNGATVTNARLTDTVPLSTSFVSASLPHTGPDAGGVITWPLGTLVPGNVATVTMVVQVAGNALSGTVINNTAWLATNEGITDTASTATPVWTLPQTATVTGLVWQDLDGNGSFSFGVEPVLPNITVVVTNSGGVAQNLVTAASGRYTATVSPGAVTVAVDQTDPDLPANPILTTANNPTTGTLTANSIFSVDFGFRSQALPPPVSDLSVSKVSRPNPIAPGQGITYTIVVSNAGPNVVTALTLTENLPAAVQLPLYTPSQGNFNPATGGWSGLSVGLTRPVTLTIVGTVDAGFRGMLSNTVVVTTGQALDPNPANNIGTDVNIVRRPGISLTKQVDVLFNVPGAPLTYTLNLINSGQVAFDQVVITDDLPTGLHYVAGSGRLNGSASEPVINNNILSWIVSGPVLPGDVMAARFVTTASNPTQYTNAATATGWFGKGTVSAAAVVPLFITDPAIDLSKNLTPPGVVNGEITFTVVLTNRGPSPVTQVDLVDSFSGPIQLVRASAPPADVNAGQILWDNLAVNLQPGEAFTLTTVFSLTPPTQETSVINQVVAQEAVDIYGNRTNTPQAEAGLRVSAPTAVTLLYFTAGQAGQAIQLTWATAVEIDNFAFRLLRSTTGVLTDSVPVAFIPAAGGKVGGASYAYADTNVVSGNTYTYWLVDIDLNGVETVHNSNTSINMGAAADSRKIYLPLIFK